MLAAIVQGASPAIARELPLGSPRLEERRATVRVAPGVVWTRIVREGGPWRVNVLGMDRGALTGRLGGARRHPARRADPAGHDRRTATRVERRVTLPEAARIMRARGAREALNLDGGGSTTMTVSGEVVNLPSDPEGERRVSNGVFVLP